MNSGSTGKPQTAVIVLAIGLAMLFIRMILIDILSNSFALLLSNDLNHAFQAVFGSDLLTVTGTTDLSVICPPITVISYQMDRIVATNIYTVRAIFITMSWHYSISAVDFISVVAVLATVVGNVSKACWLACIIMLAGCAI
jgi:hypothetical protein